MAEEATPEKTNDTRNIYQRMLAVMAQCSYVQKDQKKVAGQYTAVKHDDVVAKVRSYLIKEGVLPITTIIARELITNTVEINKVQVIKHRAEVTALVRFVNIDNPEEYFEVQSYGSGEDKGDKAIGKAISYAVKYAFLKALMLETGDDADHDASVETNPLQADIVKGYTDRIRKWFAVEGIDEALYNNVAPPLDSMTPADAQAVAQKMENPEYRAKFKASLSRKLDGAS